MNSTDKRLLSQGAVEKFAKGVDNRMNCTTDVFPMLIIEQRGLFHGGDEVTWEEYQRRKEEHSGQFPEIMILNFLPPGEGPEELRQGNGE